MDDPTPDVATEHLDLGLPLLGEPFEQESHLPTAGDWFASPLTVRERSMLCLMLALKDKPEWDRKVFDDTIVAKWRKEAMEFDPDRKYEKLTNIEYDDPRDSRNGNGEDLNIDGLERQKAISEEMFDYCILELRDNAKQFQKRGFMQALDANACVYMSDTAVNSETKARLREGVKRLENVHDGQKDWHPGSGGKVLDLVHPSLFPLLYGRSRILPSGEVPLRKCAWSTGDGVVMPKPRPEERPSGNDYSENFQWLPCQVSLDENRKAKITSYINNMYPAKNEDLYTAVEDVISVSVPMWIDTLLSTQFLATPRIQHDFHDSGWIFPPEVQRRLDEGEGDFDPYCGFPGERDYYVPLVPQPGDYQTRQRIRKEMGYEQTRSSTASMEEEETRIRQILQTQGLQVIVKLANIHLTPEKSSYDGGTWHIEGQLNEHIVASALYYYDSENITDSHLAFREGVDKEQLDDVDQHDYGAYLEIYGINDSWGDAIQQLGSVHTREDRLLVFPNVLQHCVAPFSLADKSKPGHRKLLALFFVDPFIRIPSTANVPPQQREWWAKAMEEKGSLTQRIPNELADLIVENVEDFPITLEEAKELREVLIDERRVFVDEQMEPFRENGYCFCEH